ncbi:hypothetical protein GCM10027280_60450 [Micromonospora polyrhachis]|uniref:UDP-glucose 6-dehydrogenase n=1 Tax=Micromonospora polyrhachis TaxID=1282883 RepID=A0A7W7SSR8_9ACTN|nr:hypothetical protein [Micromonospora polyrhachis]MBB4960279.1 hypothetical protein [Micromonospora polyrhachis]
MSHGNAASLAIRISFVNAIAEMCVAAGANVAELTEAIGHESRIDHHYFQLGRRQHRAGMLDGHGQLPITHDTPADTVRTATGLPPR